MNTPAPVIVITAKAHSERLPGKNMLPLGGQPLAVWSIQEARKHNVTTIVSTDSPELAQIATKADCAVVTQNPELGHQGVIQAAVEETGRTKQPVILLQPTSPFRFGDIVLRCWKKYVQTGGTSTILTTNIVHNASVENGTLTNAGHSVSLWDGNVAIYPPGKICDYSQIMSVRNLPINNLQIDTEEDYVLACATLEMVKPMARVLPTSTLHMLNAVFRQHGITGKITVVGRAAADIPQDNPVMYLNHCRGYAGGRCDVLFMIANEAIRNKGINPELRECASKAKFVIVRHNGELDWLLSSLPEIANKYYPLREVINAADDRLTTGAIAADTLNALGLTINFIGMYKPASFLNLNPQEVLIPFHYPAVSREIGLLWRAGVYLSDQ